ncbi:MAG: hypothetical protein HQL05_03390 [Nitrospirae bacterium]|uniref:hypothetical protein n=1 Tax=Candidatus Magnetobacterium casense TaxID=1455061 RepID=UPI000590DC8E|nr:hypothetical protein [Candidatus Magnetobacterium casensis]MBF0336852.1 hypothetical protein [Nitrospirota bacterium]
MTPDSKHVEALESFDDKKFAQWLRRGFEDIEDTNHSARRLAAFAPLHYFVGRRDDLIDELRDIYELLSENTQEQFRLGIVTALSKLPPKPRSVPVLRMLLHLAGSIHATEILPTVMKQADDNFFDIQKDNMGRELFTLTVDIVAGMSPDKQVVGVLHKLAGSRFFRDGYAPMTFIGLCRAEPEKFPEHLALLRGNFMSLHKKTGTDDAYLTARRFAHYVDTPIIADNLYRCSYFTNIYNLEADNWLGKALFVGEKASLEFQKRHDIFRIARTDRKKKQFFKIKYDSLDSYYDLYNFMNGCIDFNNQLLRNKLKKGNSDNKIYNLVSYMEKINPDLKEVA